MDVYVLIDPTAIGDAMVLSVHGRIQGADMAAIEYAQMNSPSTHPSFGPVREAAVQEVYQRLVIVNRDVQDDD